MSFLNFNPIIISTLDFDSIRMTSTTCCLLLTLVCAQSSRSRANAVWWHDSHLWSLTNGPPVHLLITEVFHLVLRVGQRSVEITIPNIHRTCDINWYHQVYIQGIVSPCKIQEAM